MVDKLKYVKETIKSGHTGGGGPFTEKCEKILEKELGVPKVLLTTSGTTALEMAAMLLNIKPGDEVIVPSFTFVSTANAFVKFGAKPIFADIRSDTLNMDEGFLNKLITSKTKAIIPVHYAGVGCNMSYRFEVAQQHNIAVVEDNVQGLFGKYNSRFLGTFGDLSALSFHETKTFTCGEGGALIINNKKYIERANIIRDKGTDHQKFLNGQVDRYGWVDYGSSYTPADMLAAYLYPQLKDYKQIQADRKKKWLYYYNQLKGWAQENNVQIPYIPPECESSYQIFHLVLPSPKKCQELITHLKMNGVAATTHYPPLHLSKMGQKFGGKLGDCPVTESISECLVRLPLHNGLSLADQNYIVYLTKNCW